MNCTGIPFHVHLTFQTRKGPWIPKKPKIGHIVPPIGSTESDLPDFFPASYKTIDCQSCRFLFEIGRNHKPFEMENSF